MFGKKVLSIIALLFITVKAEPNACVFSDVTAGTCSITSGCLEQEYNKYFAISGNTATYATGAVTSGILVQVNEDGTDCSVVNTPGYYKSVAADGSTEIYISRNHDGTAVSVVEPDAACTGGGLYTGGKLCAEDDDTTNVIALETGEEINYYVINDKSEIFRSDEGKVVIKADATSFTLITLPANNLYLVNNKEKAATIVDSAASTPVLTSGSYLVKDLGGKLTGVSAGQFAAVYETGALDASKTGNEEYCVDSTTKAILGRKVEYCSGNEDNCGSYYTCNSSVCIETTNVIERRTNPSTCNVDEGTYTSCSGYYLKTDKTLLYCSGGECSAKTNVIGYLVNAADPTKYIKCSSKGSKVTVNAVDYDGNDCDNIVISGLEEECTDGSAGFGALIKDGEGVKICINANDGVSVTTAAQYFIDANVADKTFTKVAQGAGALAMIDIAASGNVILNTKAGNYIYDSIAHALHGTVDSNAKDLYVCALNENGVNVCAQDTNTIGYLANAGDTEPSTVKYIKCVPNEANNSCTAIADLPEGDTCTKVGDIVDKSKICVYADKVAVGSTTLTKASLDDGARFFVDASATGIFVKDAAAGYYVIVNVKGSDITLNREASPKKYRYAVGTRVYFKGEGGATTCNPGIQEGVDEYILKSEAGDNTGYYTIVEQGN